MTQVTPMKMAQKMVVQIKLPVRIRFVGGPWHNLIATCETLTTIMTTADLMHRYQLAEFETPYGTHYYQYIHTSLISGTKVKATVCGEYFPRWEISQKQIDRRLAGKCPIPPRRLRW
jgi:hypothetical protein